MIKQVILCNIRFSLQKQKKTCYDGVDDSVELSNVFKLSQRNRFRLGIKNVYRAFIREINFNACRIEILPLILVRGSNVISEVYLINALPCLM